jgi:hypothetical protein
MNALALCLAVALAAPPFPAPRLVPYTEKMKCDMGTVLSVDASKAQLRATTPAGVVTYHAGTDVQVIDKDGKPLGTIAKLSVGQSVRVYYLVDNGAQALEVDVQ